MLSERALSTLGLCTSVSGMDNLCQSQYGLNQQLHARSHQVNRLLELGRTRRATDAAIPELNVILIILILLLRSVARGLYCVERWCRVSQAASKRRTNTASSQSPQYTPMANTSTSTTINAWFLKARTKTGHACLLLPAPLRQPRGRTEQSA